MNWSYKVHVETYNYPKTRRGVIIIIIIITNRRLGCSDKQFRNLYRSTPIYFEGNFLTNVLKVIELAAI